MTHLQHYQHLLDLSQRMLEAARHAQWEDVVVCSQEYLDAVEKLKSFPTPAAESEDTVAMQKLLRQIVTNDEEIQELAAPELKRLGSLLGDTKRHKSVVQAYCAPSMNQ